MEAFHAINSYKVKMSFDYSNFPQTKKEKVILKTLPLKLLFDEPRVVVL